MSLKKAMLELVTEAVARGWTVTRTGKGHLRFTHPTGAISFAPSTPSEYRGIKNTRANLRRIERQA